MTREQLLLEFEHFLHKEFDVRENGGNRCLFCFDFVWEQYGFDCACCMTAPEEYLREEGLGHNCGCNCHKRINQIVDFFWKYLEVKDAK